MTSRSPVLVTGGAGFIGSHLVEALVQGGNEVVVVDNLSSGRYSNLAEIEVETHNIDLRTGDLAGLLTAREFGLIFHLASHADLAASVADARRDFELNLLATFNLLDAMRRHSSEARLVNLSSAAVYRQSPDPFHEDSPTGPLSPYAVSKLAAENYVTVFARLFGIRAASARLFSVYGPRQRKQVVFDLIRKLHDDPHELAVQGDGSQVRDFNHVANVVDALMTISRSAALEGEVYNVAGDEPKSIAELVSLACQAVGAAPRVVWGCPRKGDPPCLLADTGRLRSLGWFPRVDLASGIADTIAWFRREVAGAQE